MSVGFCHCGYWRPEKSDPLKSLQAVRWAEDVVDNELMNKRSSKRTPLLALTVLLRLQLQLRLGHSHLVLAECCIFHKQRQFGDWDDTSDDEPCFNPEDRGQFPNTDPTGQCPQ